MVTWNTNVTDWVVVRVWPSPMLAKAAQTELFVVGPPGLNENLVPLAVAIVLRRASPPKSVPRFRVVASLKVIDPLFPSAAGFVEVGRAFLMTNLTCPIGIKAPVDTEELALAASPEVAPVEAGDVTATGSPSAAAIVVSLNRSAFPSREPPITNAPNVLLLPRTVVIKMASEVEIGAISHQASKTTIPAAILGLPRLLVIRALLSPPLALDTRNRHSFRSSHD